MKTFNAVVNNDSVKDNAIKLVAAYNPVVLKAAKLMGGDVRAICKSGIQVVCNYYGIKLSCLELEFATELLSYKPEANISPITTKEG
jgi:hypothetical protein